MSRLNHAVRATRPMLPARLMLSGPAGSGKTRTALIIASVLADGGDILMIDTERESALTYADDFSFDHLSWHAPYDPRELAQTLHDAGERYSVVIVDSLSHYWRKAGGTLDIAEGKFSGWKVARPAQEDMVDAILGTKCHVIVSVRSKIEYTQTTDERGRHSVQKLGMAPQQDETLEYEVNLAAELDIEHRLSIAKSRTVPLPVGKVFAPGHAEEFATIYRDWLRGGEPLPSREVVDQFLSRMNALRPEIRKEAKADWLATLGKPETLRKAQVDQAEMLVAGYEAKEASIAEAPETPLNRPEIDPQTNGGSTFPTPAKLLRTAREIAQESGVEPPSNVEAIDSDLMAAALERLGVQVPTG